MPLHRSALVRVACALLVLACDGVIDPSAHDPNLQPQPRRLSKIQLTPGHYAMVPGDTVRLVLTWIDQHGDAMPRVGTVAFASAAPMVAAVSDAGVVTGLATGRTDVVATVMVAGVSWRATMTAYVMAPSPHAGLLLVEGRDGWTPPVARVAVGDTVSWAVLRGEAPGQWSGTLWLWNRADTWRDSIDAVREPATRHFVKPDTIYYCAHDCWDFIGTIIVR